MVNRQENIITEIYIYLKTLCVAHPWSIDLIMYWLEILTEFNIFGLYSTTTPTR